MAAPGTGHGSYVQIGRESVWGTKVAATRRFRVVSSDFKAVRGKIASDALTDTVARKSYFGGPQVAGGKMELEADYSGQLHIWDAVMGTGTFGSNGATLATSTWPFFQKALLNSYTIEEIAGPIPAAKCNVLTGAKIKSLTLSGSGGLDSKPLRMGIEWVAKDYAVNQTPTGSLSANTPTPIMFHHIDTANFQASNETPGTERLRSFEISITNPLAEGRWYGADTVDEFLREDYAVSQLKWTLEFSSINAVSEYIAATITSGVPIIKFASGSTNVVIQAGVSYIVTPVGHPVNKYGLLLQDFTVEPVDDGASPSTGIKVSVTNAEGTIT